MTPQPVAPERLGSRFWQYVALVGLLCCGVPAFPLLAFHATTSGLLSDATVPVLFAVAMAVDGAAGLLVGRLYDRYGPRVLLAVPVAAAVSVLAFGSTAWLLWVGVAVWGVVNGVLDSTVKAVVSELVPSGRRAVGFGWLSFVRGGALLAAGGLLGLAYDAGRLQVALVVLVANALALAGLFPLLSRLHRREGAAGGDAAVSAPANPR